MCTIAAGQTAGLSRSAALEFSFFLSMPTMAVATGYDLLKTILPHQHDASDAAIAPLAMNAHGWIVLGIGFVVSFVVALGVVAWFMRWVRARGFAPFAIYRIVLGIVLLVLIARGCDLARNEAPPAGPESPPATISFGKNQNRALARKPREV